MKIHLTKKGMTRFCQPNELEQMQTAGWQEVNVNATEVKQVEEPIVLKPPVKSKGTVKTPDNANQQGDE
jgi:hypothetical protein